MNRLSQVFVFKIAVTVVFWCIPLLVLPADWLQALGFPPLSSYLFLRLVGWAYLALCVGYAFGLAASLRGQHAPGPIWVGIVSNGGACAWLLYFGLSGEWATWGGFASILMWASVATTAGITLGLYLFGVRGQTPEVPMRGDCST